MGESGPARIGMWERTHDGSTYRRSAVAIADWVRWADRHQFTRAKNGPRVLLLGESAARGMSLDPDFTPALLLQHCLSSVGMGPVEVIDLARIGARVDHILAVARAAVELDPDVVVTFAGNNWKYELLDGPASHRLAEARALEADGVVGVVRRREVALAETARQFVERVCEIFGIGSRMLFVVPESNLLDWHPQTLVPVLGGGREVEWLAFAGELRRAVQAADWAAALSYGERIHDLDGGLSDEVHRCIGKAALLRGDVKQALVSYRRARDVRLWYDGVDPAWLPSAGVAAATTAATRAGARVLDLSETLPEHADSGVPDRSLFLDWCHLNAKGLKIVAAEMARRIAPALGITAGSEQFTEALAESNPTPMVLAGAHFCAAVNSAHWEQPRETIAAHAAEAVRASPGITRAMTQFCAMRASSAPLWTYDTDAALPANVRRFMTVMIGGRQMHDELVVDVFQRQLRASAAHRDTPRSGRALAPSVREDLLAPAYSPSWRPLDWEGLLEPSGSTLMGDVRCHRHYFRAHSETSRFTFVLAERLPVEFDLTARLGSGGACVARVLVNDREVSSLELADRWRRFQFRAEPSTLRAGSNRLEVVWAREALAAVPFPTLASHLARGVASELSVVLGEIHSLHATALPEH